MPDDDATPPAGFELGKDGLAVILVGVDGGGPAINASAWAAGLAIAGRVGVVRADMRRTTRSSR